MLPEFGYLKANIMTVKNMEDYLPLDDNDDDADFRYNYRDTIIAQFKQDLLKKFFSRQDQGKCDENDTLQKRIKFWLNVIDMGGPISDKIYDYVYNNEMEDFIRRAESFPEIRELKKLLNTLKYK